MTLSERRVFEFGGIDCEFGGFRPLAPTSVELSPLTPTSVKHFF